MKGLQEVFAENFKRDDLEGAKSWVKKWYREMEQIIPDHEPDPSYGYTQRAMAGHISDYLEGFTGDELQSYARANKTYMSTKYGPDIYWAM